MKPPQKKEESRLNRAYGCFAFLGLVTLPFGLATLLQKIGLMNFDQGSGGLGESLSGYAYLLGTLLGGPIVIAMLVASAYGIVRTLQFRHTALAVLSANTIVCGGGTILVMFLSDSVDRPILDYITGTGFGIFVATNLVIPAWWFFNGRRHYLKTNLHGE
jgi:hypothetical protein